jgi:hypothetical protein
MRFLCELSPRTTKYELNWPAISLLGGELALPISGWPASAALIGNSDTTAKPPSWQVNFRGIEWPIRGKWGQLARQWLAGIRPDTKRAPKLKTPLQMERRFGLALALASRIFRPTVIRRTFYRLSGRFTLYRVRSFGGGSCRGLLFLAYRCSAAGTSLAPY